MANRYPLVINNNTSLVGEIQVGDALNLTSSGIFDGINTGGNGQILSSNNGSVRWIRAADVFLNDTQTLTNKTLTSCTFNAAQNTLSNVANSSLINSNININGTSVSLGGSINIPDTNDNTIYSISVADGVNSLQKRVRLTAGGSGSGVQDIFLTTNGNYLSIGRTSNDTLNFTVSIQDLTAGNYIIYTDNASTYNGLNARTIAVNASTTNIANRVVARDSNGSFSATTITSNLVGDVSGTATRVSQTLTRGNYLVGNNYDGSAATTWGVDATVGSSADRGSNKVVVRDSNGDFWARNVSGTTIRATTSVTVDRGANPHGFLRSDGSIDTSDYITLPEVPVEIPSGSRMVFYQASAPTGWTKVTNSFINNTALRIVTGSGGGAYSSGSSFTTIFATNRSTTGGSVQATTLTTTQIPAHSHSGSTGGAGNHAHSGTTGNQSANHTHTGGTSGAGGHSHSVGDPGHSHSVTFPCGGTDRVQGNDIRVSKANDITRGTSGSGTGIWIGGVGNHSHSFTTAGISNNHNHGFSTNSAGNHSHSVSVGNTGGSGSHTHGFTTPSINMNVNYIDCIVCSKN
jgi:hypothetical protein